MNAANDRQRLDECYELLKRVRSFIENGTEFGYIDPLKPGTPEHKTAADVAWMVHQLQLDRLHVEQVKEVVPKETLDDMEPCNWCDGSGEIDDTDDVCECRHCGGDGWLY